MIHQKMWLPGGGGGLISLYIYIENFKNLLVRNHWTDFIITWQNCFLVDPLPRLFVIMIHQKTWLPGGRVYFPYISISKSLKIFLSETNGPISISLARNVSLVTLYQDCSSCHDLSKNMAAGGQGIFSLYIYIENFKNLLIRNCWIQFNVTWQECCFGDLLPRLFTPSWYVKKTWPPGGEAYFSYISV